MFYSNEHEPVHVHGKCKGREMRAELTIVNGVVTAIQYSATAGRPPLQDNELRYFQEVVSARADDIVAKWIDFFVMHKPIQSERITRRLK
jgi:hypothetical protein